MRLVGTKPSLNRAECARVLEIETRRRTIQTQLTLLQVELLTLPTLAVLAREYGVARNTITKAARGYSYKHHVAEALERAAIQGAS